MKKKLLIILPVLLIAVGGAGYEFMMPKKAAAKPNLVGTVTSLPGQFTINLVGGHYATVSVALDVPVLPKTGIADVPVMRAIVTNTLTGESEDALINPQRRQVLEHRILNGINKGTDQVVSQVYFTDLAVQ